jgi:hypothetical protein
MSLRWCCINFINVVDDINIGGNHTETKGYPHAGINHPVAKLVSYRKMTVSQEEYELVTQHRRNKIKAVKRLAGLI